jgi:hypothetical protein
MKDIVSVALFVFMVGGWGLNIYKLFSCDFEAPYKTEIVRGISLFAFPIASITGWMDVGEENE